MQLWGKHWTREELEQRTGSLSQIGGITRMAFTEGKARGVTCLHVRTGGGLEFSVLPERGMDIYDASYGGRSLAWHSPAGIVHPAYYQPGGLEWLKSFGGGLLTTCGLTTAGAPSTDAGQDLGLHGSVSNTPAECVAVRQEWREDEYVLEVDGAVRETSVYGPNLLLMRRISTALGSRAIEMRDTVENQGFVSSPYMQVYHMNFGFPLVTEYSRIYAPSRCVQPLGEFSEQTAANWASFEPPTAGMKERVYYHDMEAGDDGLVRVVLVSDDRRRDFAVLIGYRKAELPQFVEWKMPGANHFVLGLEPANCRVEGRRRERERGTLQTLAPGEKREMRVMLQVVDGAAEVEQVLLKAGTPA